MRTTHLCTFAPIIGRKTASLLYAALRCPLFPTDPRSIPLVARITMPPKTSQVEQSAGFIAKKEDFPSLSPGGASVSGVQLQDRTSRLEDFTADLARSVAALHEGQQQLVGQIGSLIHSVSAASAASPPVSSSEPNIRVPEQTFRAAQPRPPRPAANFLRGF